MQPIGHDERVRPSPRATYRELMDGSGAVVLNLDTAAYHGLNPIGSAIWRLLGDGSTFGALVERLRATIEDPPPRLEAEVTTFLRSLEERDLVVIGGADVVQP